MNEVGANVHQRARIAELSRELAILNAKMLARDDAFLELLKSLGEGHKAAVDIYVDGFPDVLQKIDEKIIKLVDEKIGALG